MWTVEPIAGREAEIFLPSRPVRFPVLFLTDWDDHSPREHESWERHFEEYQFAVFVLRTGDGWWSSKPLPSLADVESPAHWLLRRFIPELRQRYATQPVGVIGLGAGGQGGLRLGFENPREFRAVVSLEGCLDFHELHGRGTSLDDLYETRELARQDTPVLRLRSHDVPPCLYLGCSADSPWLQGNDRLREKLAALGVSHAVDFGTSVCGHSWTYYETMAPRVVRYLAEGLKTDSLKLA